MNRILNFIYRIYEVNISKIKRSDSILNQEVMIAESREAFKENIRLLYPNIKFANNGKLKDGDIYCIIISDNCYNPENYLTVLEFECSHCKKTFKSNQKLLHKYLGTYEFRNSNILPEILNNYQTYITDLCFCSKTCELEHKQDIIKMLEDESALKYADNDFIPDVFITKDTFTSSSKGGYIYKITKKSTGEFYIGQTAYVPIFRWGQHLLTERFSIHNISDYTFEIIEVVEDRKILRDRETYWIIRYNDECPDLILNIVIPKEKID